MRAGGPIRRILMVLDWRVCPLGPGTQEAAHVRGGRACVARVRRVGEKKKTRVHAVDPLKGVG